MEPGLKLSKDMCPTTAVETKEMGKIPYLNAMGALNDLAIGTQLDISYVLHILACFNSNPGLQHWKAVKHLFHYLQGMKHLGITYQPDPNTQSPFTTFADLNFARNKDNK